MLNFDWLSGLSENWGRVFIIIAFLMPLIFTFTMKRKYIFQGAPDRSGWRNLKFWVLILVVVQIAVYLYF